MRICNSEANTCIPLDAARFDLEGTASRLRSLGYELELKQLMMIARKDGVEYTLYRTGKLLIHPMSKEAAKDAAADFYQLCMASKDEN